MTTPKKIKKKRLIFVVDRSVAKSRGVELKIRGMEAGFKANDFKVSRATPFSLLGKIISIHFPLRQGANHRLIWYRFDHRKALAVAPIILLARLIGYKTIVEFPTPPDVVAQEARHFQNIILASMVVPIACLIYRISNICVGYGKDRYVTSVKGILTTNGIELSHIRKKGSEERIAPSKNTFTGIFIARLTKWHGVEKLIEAYCRASLNSKNSLKLYIVGDGPLLEDVKKKASEANKLCGKQVVICKGEIVGPDLENILNQSHVGFGGLSYGDKGLTVASELKLRTYCAYGVPFVYFVEDPQFEDRKGPWRRCDPDQLDIIEIKRWFELEVGIDCSSKLRLFAKNNFSWSTILESILSRATTRR